MHVNAFLGLISPHPERPAACNAHGGAACKMHALSSHQAIDAYQLDTDILRGGLRDAKLAGNNNCGKRESAAHVDGAVICRHGKGALPGKELRDEREADGVLG